MLNTTHIILSDLSKQFHTAGEPLEIIYQLNATITQGEMVAIIGPSGSGKSTLLSLLAGLDTPTAGDVIIKGRKLSELNEQQLANFRNREIGIVFQSFELLTPFTVFENIHAPLDLAGKRDSAKVTELAKQVGLLPRLNSYPRTLSGGEKQRVAIARALINDPDLILADEPTGNLDSQTGQAVLELLINEVQSRHKTLVVITHDHNLAARMDRVFELRNGQLYENR